MRKRFEMTQEQLEKLLDACKPTPVMFLSGGVPMGRSVQENANDAWAAIGSEMGFQHMTVQPAGGDMKVFTAEEV